MNEQQIKGLWSASSKLANHEPLDEKEELAVLSFLKKGVGVSYPTRQEYENYLQDKEILDRYRDVDYQKETVAYFIARVKQYENKYLKIGA